MYCAHYSVILCECHRWGGNVDEQGTVYGGEKKRMEWLYVVVCAVSSTF